MPFDAMDMERIITRVRVLPPTSPDADLLRKARASIAQPHQWTRRAFRRYGDAICPVEAIHIITYDHGATRKRLIAALAKHMPWPLRCFRPQLAIIYYNDWFCRDHAALMTRMDRTIEYLDRAGG